MQIKLADKQAALEKIQWEAMTSNRKVEKLGEEIESMHADISSYMLLFEGLTKDDPTTHSENYDVSPYYLGHLPPIVSSYPPSWFPFSSSLTVHDQVGKQNRQLQ